MNATRSDLARERAARVLAERARLQARNDAAGALVAAATPPSAAARPAPAPGSAATATARNAAPPRRNWPLYLFVFLLPLQNIQTGYLPSGGGGLNFLNLGFLLSLLGAWRVGGTLAGDTTVNRWAVIYIVYSIASLFIGYANIPGMDNTATLKDAMIAVLMLFVVQKSIVDLEDAKRLLIATMLPIPYMFKVVLVQHDSVSHWHYSDELRIQGTFALLGANEFAAFCVTVALVLLGLLLATKLSLRWRIALAGSIACMATGVVFGYSRTAYVAILLGVAVIFLLWRGRWKMLLPLVLAAVVLPTVLPQSVIDRFDTTTIESDKRDESTDLRFQFWQVAWHNFEEHPLFGSGYQTFRQRQINPYGMDTHNFFMRTLTEGGIVGALIVLGLFLSLLNATRNTLRMAPNASWAHGISLGMMGAWIALVCGNCFGDRFTYYPMIAFFWVYVGVMLKLQELEGGKDSCLMRRAVSHAG